MERLNLLLLLKEMQMINLVVRIVRVGNGFGGFGMSLRPCCLVSLYLHINNSLLLIPINLISSVPIS